LRAQGQAELPGSVISGGAAGSDGHKPREKEEAAVLREGLEVTEGSGGRDVASSTSKSKSKSKSKAKVPAAAGE